MTSSHIALMFGRRNTIHEFSIRLLLRKALSILSRRDESLHHLGLNEVAIKLIKFIQPEVIALKVECRFRRIIGITAQVSEILHQHERAVELLLSQR